MAQTARKTDAKLRTFTREEGSAYFNQQAQHWLGISGDEFVKAWESGKFDDDPDRPGVMEVAILLPLVK